MDKELGNWAFSTKRQFDKDEKSKQTEIPSNIKLVFFDLRPQLLDKNVH